MEDDQPAAPTPAPTSGYRVQLNMGTDNPSRVGYLWKSSATSLLLIAPENLATVFPKGSSARRSARQYLKEDKSFMTFSLEKVG